MRGWSTPGRPHGFLALLTGLLVSVFVGTFIYSTPVFADDATWNNGNIELDGQTYSPVTDKADIKQMGYPDGALVFTTSYDKTPSTTPQSVKAISFIRGTDISKATTASGSEFAFTPPDSWVNRSSFPVTIDESSYQGGQGGSSCEIDRIGWLICGPSMFIADGVDLIYGWIEDFLSVRELEVTNTSSTLYQAWDIMRGIANAGFIIAFLVIIYSHVSSFGLSNYGIKKLASRLIIAALLVNLSYYICAIAVDLSNIIGHTLKAMFDDLTSQLVGTGVADNEGILSASSLIQAVLSGGTLLISGGIAVGASLLAAAPLILPLLLTVFVALLVALVVFAVRQALIVILVVISPLAFLCYLLPGTEKWFEKWRSTLTTMLIFFPAFAVVFGGSKLAGVLIVSNASTIVMIIIGWAVQLAPLALAPLVMKLGGGILNRVAGIVNDPTRGAIDKTKSWARDKSKQISYDRTYGNDKLKGWNAPRYLARSLHRRGQLMKDRMAEAEKRAENSYHDWDKYKKQDLKNRQTNDQSELLTQQASNRYDELKAGHYPTDIGQSWSERQLRRIPRYDSYSSAREADFTNEAGKLHESIAVEGMKKANAQRELNRQFADQMIKSDELKALAGGNVYMQGADAALASSIATMRSDYGKSVDEGKEILEHFNLSSEDRQRHALGQTVEKEIVVDGVKVKRIFKSDNVFTQEAAITKQVKVGTVDQVSDIIAESGSSLSAFKGTISSALAESGVKDKAPFLGGKLIDDIAKADIKSKDDLNRYIQEWVAGAKFRDKDIAVTDPQGLGLLIDAIKASPVAVKAKDGETPAQYAARQAKYDTDLVENIAKLRKSAAFVLQDGGMSPMIGTGAKPILEDLRDGRI